MTFVTPAVYTIAEACAVARIRRSTLYKHIRSGHLRAIKIGGRTCVPVHALYSWLEAMPPANPPGPETGMRAKRSAVVQHESEHLPHPDEQKTHQ